MTASGLLVNGEHVLVPGVTVYAPGDMPDVRLSPDDCISRSNRPQQWICHKTEADFAEHVLPGAGPVDAIGGTLDSAREWAADKRHAGSHLIVGYDGEALCLADLVRVCAWHDSNIVSNRLSVGMEMKERHGGLVYEATLASAVEITIAGMRALGIQFQCPRHYRNNMPFPRFADGGRDLVGCFGHRDVSATRGYWDPGDIIFDMLQARGYERFDFYGAEDLETWKKRQAWLRELGVYSGPLDGIPGRGTTAALKTLGYPDGIFALGREVADLPRPPG